jgi:FkbM family methyltransferase
MVPIARARLKTASALEAVGLLKAAQRVTAPFRLPITHRRLRGFYGRLIGPGELAFDIGANVGAHTAALLDVGASVVSVEPQSSCIAALRKRFDDRVRVVAAAVASEAGEAELFLSSESSERATLRHEWTRTGYFTHGWQGSEVVRVTTLDRLIEEYGRPTLCKIDVETYEREVLAGLTFPVCTIVFEFGTDHLQDALSCIVRLQALADYRFTFRVGQSPRFAAGWSTGRSLETALAACGPGLSGDIIGRRIT